MSLLGKLLDWLLDPDYERISTHDGDGHRAALDDLGHAVHHGCTHHRVEQPEADSGHRDPDEQYEPKSSRVNHDPSLVIQCPVCGCRTLHDYWSPRSER